MTSIIEKRLSMHRLLEDQQTQNTALQLQTEKLEALANIGMAASMIAHEINNLLTPLAGYAALARKNPDDTALVEKALSKTVGNSQRAAKVTESLLALATGQTEEKTDANLGSLVQQIFDCLCRDFSKDGITVIVDIPEQLTIRVIPVQLQQVLMNLIFNAREAMLPTGGTLTIRARRCPETTTIDVTDTGCGIRPENLDRIFEPFFSTKANDKSPSGRRACGLGLAFCKRIIDVHKGSIAVESEPQKKTAFRITLPGPQSGNS